MGSRDPKCPCRAGRTTISCHREIWHSHWLGTSDLGFSQPDVPLRAHCWWKGLLPSAPARPAGAAQGQGTWLDKGVFVLFHTRPCHSLCSQTFPAISEPQGRCELPGCHWCSGASSRRSWPWLQPGPQLKQPHPGLHPAGMELLPSAHKHRSGWKPACTSSQPALSPGLLGMPGTRWFAHPAAPVACHLDSWPGI